MLPDFDRSRVIFDECGLELTKENYEKLEVYSDFLLEYNENVNLTAITEPEEILIKHFADSVLLLKYVDVPQNSTIIDVGTGAGFPSVPIKIFRPDIELTLLDSLNKRTIFLTELCKRLDISAHIIHGRAEDVSKMAQYREKFDVSCARAVANLSVLSELCLPFVRVEGKFLAMKGPSEDILSAKSAVELLGGELSEPVDYDLFGEKRRIIAAKKISHTPTKYPRNSARIKKNPL